MVKINSAWAIAFKVLSILALISIGVSNLARAQGTDGETTETETAEIAPSGVATMQWAAEAPALTPEQSAQLAYWAEKVNLPGPERPGAASEAAAGAALDVGSQSVKVPTRLSPKAPLAPGDAQIYRKTAFGGVVPAGLKSNTMGSSVSQNGKFAFFTGNWFAARSTDGGVNWSYLSAYSGFPDFCCDQVTLYDASRGTLFWLRTGTPNEVTGVNSFRLGVSNDGGATFCNYETSPFNVNSNWKNQWWDSPAHIQLGADYLYMAWNLRDTAGNWMRSVMLRWPLNALNNCAVFSSNYFQTTSWFNVVPVQGADHVMYFASNYPTSSPFNRLNIWRWFENATSLSAFTKTISPWNYTKRGEAVCGNAAGNWARRTDDRLLSGARYFVQGKDLAYPGRAVLGWWWNVKQGGSFPRPYIEAAAFFEDTLAQVPGPQGRPLVWSPTTCFLYPSAAANQRGDLGLVFHYGNGPALRPAVGFAIADDFVNAPPAFTYYQVQLSNARPSDTTWGDYNTTRGFYPSQDTWVAGSHYIPGTTNCAACSAPVFFNFGRGRDYQSWYYWRNK